MQARDATGRKVSLLNDESYSRPLNYQSTHHYQSTREHSPLPNTPELSRSDSYDSNTNYDPVSPMTPVVFDFGRAPYDDYLSEKPSTLKRPSYVDSTRSNSYNNEEDSSNGALAPERQGKRYPCRYRDSHGCEKTFTTSGHASRHSKIHTAEKAVHCTFHGCHKKFTRADNMKQHLETHFKDKSRSSSSSKSSSRSSLSVSKRSSTSSRSATSPGSPESQDVTMWDADQYGMITDAASAGAWDLRGLKLPIMSRPGPARTSSGLDALAAIACQEGF